MNNAEYGPYGHIEQLECGGCFNRAQIGLAVMTESECQICGKPMMFENSLVHALCNECAAASNRCRKCGGEK